MLPMCGHIGARFIQMNMLVYTIDSGYRDEVVVLSVWRTLFSQFDFVTLEMIDASNHFSVRRNDVHVFFDLGRIGHWPLPRCKNSEN